jgi:hypothetical protein
VRILALGVLNTPKTLFSVNNNAWALLHPPRIRILESAGDHSWKSASYSDDQDSEHPYCTDRIGLDVGSSYQIRHPTPCISHENYPMYTPGGFDRRWVQPGEIEETTLKWVGTMMYV